MRCFHKTFAIAGSAIALAAASSAAPAFAAAEWVPGWLELENGSLVHEEAGVFCPNSFDHYHRIEADADLVSGFCAYQDKAAGDEFSVQFYQGPSRSIDQEIDRTLAHFEDEGAVASIASSVGCEGRMTAARHPAEAFGELEDTASDFDIDDNVRCLVMAQAETEKAWIVSIQEMEGWFISVVATTPNLNDAQIDAKVGDAADFQAMQFSQPSV